MCQTVICRESGPCRALIQGRRSTAPRERRAESENDVSFSQSGAKDAHATGKAVIMWSTRAYVAARAPDDWPVRLVCQLLRLHACSEMVANP